MTDNSKFKNPYAPIGEKFSRITTEVSVADYNLVKCMRPSLGTITGTLGTLWFKLCNELRQRNLTDVSSCDEFERFVANCVILDRTEFDQLQNDAANGRINDSTSGIRHSPVGRSPETGPGHDIDDGTRIESIRPTDTPNAPVVSDIQSSRRGKRSAKDKGNYETKG